MTEGVLSMGGGIPAVVIIIWTGSGPEENIHNLKTILGGLHYYYY